MQFWQNVIQICSFLRSVQNRYRAHPASYPIISRLMRYIGISKCSQKCGLYSNRSQYGSILQPVCVLEVPEWWCVRVVKCIAQFEERANLKFLLKLGNSNAITLQALQTVYGDTAFKKNSHVWLVLPLQNWARTSRRGALPLETFKFCKCWNNFKGEDGVRRPNG